MKIVTAVFDYPGEVEYSRCVNVLKTSVKKNCPSASLDVIRINPPDECYTWNKPGWHNNHIKLQAYADYNITEPTFFVDADTMVLRDLEPIVAEADGFDAVISKRVRGAIAPYNLGVILVMPTNNARVMMKSWIAIDRQMLNHIDLHQAWRSKYRGQNQASFGLIYESLDFLSIKKMPTKILNACEQDWGNISDAYIVHVKTRLRTAALGYEPIEMLSPNLREAAKIWREYERQGL